MHARSTRGQLQLLAVLAAALLAACNAVAAPAIQAQDTIDGLTGAGYACDAGTNTSHTDTVVFACTKAVDGGSATATLESAGTDVRKVTFQAPRGAGDAAARSVLSDAFTAAGVGGGVASSISGWLAAWGGAQETASFGQVDLSISATDAVVDFVVELPPS
jgi:hypothetical protein